MPTIPVLPAASIFTVQTCCPALSATPVLLTVVQVCHPPVFGTVMGPVMSTPLASTWNVPPFPDAATRASMVYVPAVVTFTVYFSHSPAAIQPTLYPPPVSEVPSMSTSVLRYCAPELPAVVST